MNNPRKFEPDPRGVERVAIALFGNDPRYDGQTWCFLSESAQEMFRSDARVAIIAYLNARP